MQGALSVDPGRRRTTIGDAEVHLTPTEFDLLVCLAREPGQVLTRERLLADVWGWGEATLSGVATRTVDSHVKALRQKLGAGWIRTVHGVGYALEVPGVKTLLDAATSIKVKLGALVAVSVIVVALLATLGSSAGVPVWLTLPVAVLLTLGVTQLLAAGMVAPLRSMTEVAQRMARGDYSGRVRTTSTDEVGRLAAVFNQMAGDLALVEAERRDLIATVSHELRTPLAAMIAVLENLADGVVPADAQHLDGALAQAERLRQLVTDLLDLSRLEAGVTRLQAVDGARPRPRDRLHRRGRRCRPHGGVRRRDPRRPGRPGRRGPAAPAARQRLRQRRATRARRLAGPRRRCSYADRLVAHGRRPWPRGRRARPRACVPALRHRRHRRRHRARPRGRPLGGAAARRHPPLHRPRRPASPAPCSDWSSPTSATRPARVARGGHHDCSDPAARPARPPAPCRRP